MGKSIIQISFMEKNNSTNKSESKDSALDPIESKDSALETNSANNKVRQLNQV